MRSATVLWIVAISLIPASCTPPSIDPQRSVLDATSATMEAVSLNDPGQPMALANGVALAAAGNQWTSFTLQLRDLPSAEGYWIRAHALELDNANANIALSNFEPAQILPMPVDLDRAGYVRHTGLSTAGRNLPRALIPAQFDPEGSLNLRMLRDPNHPADPQSQVGGAGSAPVLIWIDLHVPAGTRAGQYLSRVDLMRAGQDKPVASVPLNLTVYPFDLPSERHLQMIGEISWDRLVQHYAGRFETFTPRLINRSDPRYHETVRTLDQLVALAEKHRTAVYVPRLQPTVKWAQRGQPPQVDWGDVDSLLAPWLNGSAFADGVGLKYWPLPAPDLLTNWNRPSQLEYWFEAATHFDQLDLLQDMSVSLEQVTPGRAGAEESISLSAQAAEILATHPRIRVTLPLEDDQIQFASPNNPRLIDSSTTTRLLTSVPSLVFAPPAQPWPRGVVRPEHWLRSDLPGLLPYVGAGGDEHDVRTWAFLAFLRHASYVMWNSPLPTVSSPSEPADPNELIWFYPGQWFGLDEPVPTIQLKWLRHAEEDFEYLYLAKERGEELNAYQMARLITKPVEIQPGEVPDPTYSLMSGTTDPQAWSEAESLLAQTVALRQPKQEVNPVLQHQLYIRTLQWAEPQERPLLIGRSADWSWDNDPATPNLIDLRMGMDIYNASDETPGDNQLQWAALPPAWTINPPPVAVPSLRTYHVLRASLDAKFDTDQLSPSARLPMELDFVDGSTHVSSPLRLVLPVSASDHREGRLSIDGSLDDWSDHDALQDGPMIVMLNRPALQRQQLQRAATQTHVYSAWAADNFYVAFSLQGIAEGLQHHAQNFVTYKDRRAWGEDLCEILVQPVYRGDNSLGTVLHIVCKPNGGVWVERKLDERLNVRSWEVVEDAAVRYATTTPGSGDWRGELAIPWKLIGDPMRGLPALLRFNFVQHKSSSGESASWSGPIDFGRDNSFMGVLFLRTADRAGAMRILHGNESAAQ
jgi:hypothetical protein